MTSPSSTPARGVVTAPCQQREAHACSQVFTCVHRMRSTDMATMNAPPSALNTETTIALSQSMDSVNTTPEEEVSEQCSLHYCVVFILLSVRPSVRPSVCVVCPPNSPTVCVVCPPNSPTVCLVCPPISPTVCLV